MTTLKRCESWPPYVTLSADRDGIRHGLQWTGLIYIAKNSFEARGKNLLDS